MIKKLMLLFAAVFSGASAFALSPYNNTAIILSRKPEGIGPRVPRGPQGSIRCPAGSVAMVAGNTLQTIVNAHSAGTSYCLAAGTYLQQSITPKAGDTYTGNVGTILDGQNTTTFAIVGNVANVTVQNLVIQNYNAAGQIEVVGTKNSGGANWTIKNNEIKTNAAVGVGVTSGGKVIANYIHDNVEEGYACIGNNNVFTDNEISNNNPNNVWDPGFEAGGGKCVNGLGLTIKHNYVHDNHGPGIWEDIDVAAVDVEYNDVENNFAAGIEHEISWWGIIAHNYVKNNSSTGSANHTQPTTGTTQFCTGWLWCSGIQIAASGGVSGQILDVHDNTVISSSALNGNSVGLIQQNRGSGTYGTHLVRSVKIHNNTISIGAGNSAFVGGVQDNGDVLIFSGGGNQFCSDSYIAPGASTFNWNNTTGSLSFFRGQGQETC